MRLEPGIVINDFGVTRWMRFLIPNIITVAVALVGQGTCTKRNSGLMNPFSTYTCASLLRVTTTEFLRVTTKWSLSVVQTMQIVVSIIFNYINVRSWLVPKYFYNMWTRAELLGVEEVTWLALHIQQRRHKAMINDSLNYHTIIARKSNK